MPIYEYACRSCGNEFETLVRASETPACSCGSEDLEKKLSVFAAQKGGSAGEIAPCGTCGNPGGPGSCSLN
jgi:putative FmdB family regulatory protein